MTTINEKFNLTEIIEYYHIHKIQLPEIFKTLNFTEECSKWVEFTHKGKLEKIEIKEKVNHNIVKNLPLEAYKDILSLDWVHKNYRESLIYSALYKKRFDVVDWYLDKIDEKQKELESIKDIKKRSDYSKEIQGYHTDVSQNVLSFIFNYNMEYIDYSKEDMKTYLKLMDKTTNLLLEATQLNTSPIYRMKKQVIPSKDSPLLQKYDFVNSDYKNSIEAFLKNFILSDDFEQFKFFFNQLGKEQKEEIFLKTGENCLSYEALVNTNKKVFEFLENQKLVHQNCYLEAFGQAGEYLMTTNKLKSQDIKNNLWLYQKCLEKIKKEDYESFVPQSIIGFAKTFKDNPILMDDIRNRFQHISKADLFCSHDKILENTSLSELNLYMDCMNKLNISSKQIDAHFNSQEYQVIKELSFINEIFDSPSKNDIVISKMMDSSTGNNFIHMIEKVKKISYNQAKTTLLEILMESKLENNKIKNPKVKI